MKNFNDFRSNINSGVLESLESDALDELNRHIDENPIEDPLEQLAWFHRNYSALITTKLLEQYHNWLHTD